MNVGTIKGVGTAQEAEVAFLFGYNGAGAEIAQGTPVCWSTVINDGKTFALPITANFNTFAGICVDTVGTAKYTNRLQAYGLCSARTYGVATTFVPGANLSLITAKTYLGYDSQNILISQHRAMSALSTNATVTTVLQPILVRAL